MTIHTAWVEVSTSALRHNLVQVRDLVGPSVKIMAVVKANAYGHGAVGAAQAFASGGVDYLGVTTLEEGLELRNAGISIPILMFSPLLPDQVESAVEANLEQTVCDIDAARAIDSTAARMGKKARVHVKVDTGMGRLGVNPDDSPNFFYALTKMESLEIAGTYTHFANAGSENLSHAKLQNSQFVSMLECLRSKDIPTGLCHASNSAAMLNLPDAHYDMVRPGTVLYGQYPTRNVAKKLDLRDTWTLKARITAIRKLPAGTKVGYGSEFTTKRPTLAAVIPVGFAEGFTLIPESAARRGSNLLRATVGKIFGKSRVPWVSIRESHVQVLGRVSMQMCTVDVTDVMDVQVGEEVIVPARRVTTSNRVPRIYVE